MMTFMQTLLIGTVIEVSTFNGKKSFTVETLHNNRIEDFVCVIDTESDNFGSVQIGQLVSVTATPSSYTDEFGKHWIHHVTNLQNLSD